MNQPPTKAGKFGANPHWIPVGVLDCCFRAYETFAQQLTKHRELGTYYKQSMVGFVLGSFSESFEGPGPQ